MMKNFRFLIFDLRLLTACTLVFASLALRAANPTFGSFNTNQFNTAGNQVSVKSGASVSNLQAQGYLNLSGKTNRLTDDGSQLLRDGVAIGGGGGDTLWTNDNGIITIIPDHDGFWVTNNGSGGVVFAALTDSGTLSGGAQSFMFGSVSTGTLLSGPQAFVGGFAGAGSISADSDAAFAFGYLDGQGTISSSSQGGFAFGRVGQDSGSIQATASGAIGAGYVQEGTITAGGDGAVALGTVGGGSLNSSGLGSFAVGRVSSGILEATSGGAFAAGSVEEGKISAAADGAVALGGAEDGTVEATAVGAIAGGYADDGTIRASAGGAVSWGFVNSPDSIIEASALGAVAFGSVGSSSGQVLAGGEGSLAWGYLQGGAIRVAGGAGAHASGYAASNSLDTLIEASGDASISSGYAQDGQIRAEGTGAHASGVTIEQGDIVAAGASAFAHGIAPLDAAGESSFVIGGNASASHNYAFVANFDPSAPLSSTADSTFSVRSTNGVFFKGGSTIFLSGTTNHVSFGATNTPPTVTAAPTHWISVQVQGDATAYRIPLYQ